MLHLDRPSFVLPSMMSLSAETVLPVVSAMDKVTLSTIQESSSPHSVFQAEEMVTDKEPAPQQQEMEVRGEHQCELFWLFSPWVVVSYVTVIFIRPSCMNPLGFL